MKTNFNIVSHFFEQAEKFPDQIAIHHQNESISYSRLKQEVIQTAAYFHSRGIRKGDRVLLFVPMSIDLYRNVLALFYLGATAVFLDEWVSKKRLELCCRIADCKAFIGSFKIRLMALFSADLRKIPIKPRQRFKNMPAGNFQPEGTFENDTALITFTTGSTGTPKAAKRTHGFLHEQFKALKDKINPLPGDVDLTTLPIVLLINLGAGSTSIISTFKAARPEKTDLGEIARTIARFEVSRIIASPYFVLELARYLEEKHIRLQSLKQIFTGGAPVFRHEAARILKGIPGCELEIVYGSTEAEPISSIRGKELVSRRDGEKGLCVGLPYHGTKVRIITISEEKIRCETEKELDGITLGQGRIGEIIVSGAHVLDAYFNNEKALLRNKIFVGNTCWHRSGDSGFLDENGELFLCGRCSSLFEHRGEIVAPFVYENRLQAIPGIKMATVLKTGEKVKLIIETAAKRVPEEQKNLEALIAATQLVYDNIVYIPKIPRDPRHHSKIDYEKLKSLL